MEKQAFFVMNAMQVVVVAVVHIIAQIIIVWLVPIVGMVVIVLADVMSVVEHKGVVMVPIIVKIKNV